MKKPGLITVLLTVAGLVVAPFALPPGPAHGMTHPCSELHGHPHGPTASAPAGDRDAAGEDHVLCCHESNAVDSYVRPANLHLFFSTLPPEKWAETLDREVSRSPYGRGSPG